MDEIDLQAICAEWVKELGAHYVWEPYLRGVWQGWIRCNCMDRSLPALIRVESTRLCIIDPLVANATKCHIDREYIDLALPNAFECGEISLIKAHSDYLGRRQFQSLMNSILENHEH
jgi:hypothetical protein